MDSAECKVKESIEIRNRNHKLTNGSLVAVLQPVPYSSTYSTQDIP